MTMRTPKAPIGQGVDPIGVFNRPPKNKANHPESKQKEVFNRTASAPPEAQLTLNLEVVAEAELDGVEMFVLKDGTPCLSLRGLARMCGVMPSALNYQAVTWASGAGRASRFGRLLIEEGYRQEQLFIPTSWKGQAVHAFPEKVCIAFVKYYALAAEERNQTQEAKRALNTLVSKTFRDFVYAVVGYDPGADLLARWKPMLERVELNHDPAGYFSVFVESRDLITALISHGLRVDTHTIPDISIGQVWGRHWTTQNLSDRFGERFKVKHLYPPDHPQVRADPEAWVYPEGAVPEHRRWRREVYIPLKLEPYLQGKVASKLLSAPLVRKILSAVRRPTLPGPSIRA